MKPPDKKPPTGAEAVRKTYSPPVVRKYGTIRAITGNAGTKSGNSDGPGMTSKTA
jgi:hypothetical protein